MGGFSLRNRGDKGILSWNYLSCNKIKIEGMDIAKELKDTSGNAIRDIARFGPIVLERPLSKEAFFILASHYPELQMEREPNGKIKIMSPVKFGSGNRESIVLVFLGIWWLKTKSGKIFSPSTGIELPDGAIRSPDCGWISSERLSQVSLKEQEENFLKVVPDFIVEVRSKTDRLAVLKRKMEQVWMKNGVRLAWLIDPYAEKVYVYRENGKNETVKGFESKKILQEPPLYRFRNRVWSV